MSCENTNNNKNSDKDFCKQYTVTVQLNKNENNNSSKIKSYDSAQLALEVAKTEYIHCYERAQKLELKLQIIFAILGVFLDSILSIVEDGIDFRVAINRTDWIVNLSFFLTGVITTLLYFVILCQLISMLKAIKIRRFDSCEILEMGLVDNSKETLVKYVCQVYEQCRYYNNNMLEKLYLKFNKCLFWILIEIGALIGHYFIRSII